MSKSVVEKARVKQGTTMAALNDDQGLLRTLGLPLAVGTVEPCDAQILCLLARTRAELDAQLPAAEKILAPGAALWVFFRKGSKAAGHDLNRDDVWSVAEKQHLRPLGLISADESWSVFRFRR
jgi:hypothetical protein